MKFYQKSLNSIKNYQASHQKTIKLYRKIIKHLIKKSLNSVKNYQTFHQKIVSKLINF